MLPSFAGIGDFYIVLRGANATSGSVVSAHHTDDHLTFFLLDDACVFSLVEIAYEFLHHCPQDQVCLLDCVMRVLSSKVSLKSTIF